MGTRKVILHRLLQLVPTVLGISTLTFILIHLTPGDPARNLSGPFASEEAVEDLRRQMGLDQSLPVQYWRYLSRLVQGDLGFSWFTQSSVRGELLHRVPATLELITYALLLCVLVMVPLGIVRHLIRNRLTRIIDRIIYGYGLLAGSLPDFLVGLILVFFFFHLTGLAPAPLGRLGLEETPPGQITGAYTIDSLLRGQWSTFVDAIQHLVLPVVTLAFVYGAGILKITQATFGNVMESRFVTAARMLGFPERTITRYAFRNALPPIITLVAVTYGFLIGGAVLVEQIFAWGGIGQYAVESIVNSDYVATQGFVLFTAVLVVLIYLVVDILYVLIDPRSA